MVLSLLPPWGPRFPSVGGACLRRPLGGPARLNQIQIYPDRESNLGLFSFLRAVALSAALCRRSVSSFIPRDLAAAVLSFVQIVQLIAALAGPLGTCLGTAGSHPAWVCAVASLRRSLSRLAAATARFSALVRVYFPSSSMCTTASIFFLVFSATCPNIT